MAITSPKWKRCGSLYEMSFLDAKVARESSNCGKPFHFDGGSILRYELRLRITKKGGRSLYVKNDKLICGAICHICIIQVVQYLARN